MVRLVKKGYSVLFVFSLLVFQHQVFAVAVQKYQSLSLQEKKAACQSAISEMFSNIPNACEDITQTSTGLRRASSPNASVNNTELLLIERRLSDKTSQGKRLADVYTYNYQTDTLTHSIINLQNKKVLRSEDVQHVQLPLTADEVSRSRKIASNDSKLRGYLEKEFTAITGKPLQSLDQLEVKAFVFLAKSMPGQVNQAAKACGIHRCARLVMHTTDRIALETAPVIDLSTGSVAQNKAGDQ